MRIHLSKHFFKKIKRVSPFFFLEFSRGKPLKTKGKPHSRREAKVGRGAKVAGREKSCRRGAKVVPENHVAVASKSCRGAGKNPAGFSLGKRTDFASQSAQKSLQAVKGKRNFGEPK